LDLGFAFVEIGSVTPQPQPGNDRPRIFRLPYDEALINRYGCNSHGMQAVAQNLEAYHDKQKQQKAPPLLMAWFQSLYSSLPPWIQSTLLTAKKALSTEKPAVVSSSNSVLDKKGLLGINIARNRNGDASDFSAGVRALAPLADYLVLNISSPNTPGLRQELQYDLPNLRKLLQQVVPLAHEFNKPLLVKLSPDPAVKEEEQHSQEEDAAFLDKDQEWHELGQLLLECQVDGIVVCNTTTFRPPHLLSSPHVVQEQGGLSGKPLKDHATECIRKLYAGTRGNIPIIGVGGVSTGEDVYDKLKAGASLVQVYTAMVYGGPGIISRLRHELAAIMLQHGQRHIVDVIGQDHEDIVWAQRQERLLLAQEAEAKNAIVDE
jgi:dihydroorotate dehydrogenase